MEMVIVIQDGKCAWHIVIGNHTCFCQCMSPPWWRHQTETFSALLALGARNSPVIGEFSPQRPVTRSFGVFFDLRLNKRLSKDNRFGGDSRRHCANYDVSVMKHVIPPSTLRPHHITGSNPPTSNAIEALGIRMLETGISAITLLPINLHKEVRCVTLG